MTSKLSCIVLLFIASHGAAKKIGFFATMTHISTISEGDTVKFDKELYNENGGLPGAYGYSSDTGEFVCPTSGSYEFSCQLFSSEGGSEMKFELKKGSSTIMKLMLQPNYREGSGSVIKHCRKGEAVKVIGLYGEQITLHYSRNWFSGYLLSDKLK